jgi:hypothetical protein
MYGEIGSKHGGHSARLGARRANATLAFRHVERTSAEGYWESQTALLGLIATFFSGSLG